MGQNFRHQKGVAALLSGGQASNEMANHEKSERIYRIRGWAPYVLCLKLGRNDGSGGERVRMLLDGR